MTWEEFADLWHELPLDGKRLAAIMKTTPGNIAVLRCQVRARLRFGKDDESKSERKN